MRRSKVYAFLVAFSLLVGLPAFANSLANSLATSELRVNVKVARICFVQDADLDFGVVDGMFGTDTRADTDLHVTCTEGVHYFLTINTGANEQSNIRRLRPAGKPNYIEYFLFQPDNATPWNIDSYVSSIGTGEDQQFKVYGLIPKGQPPVPGTLNYNDDLKVNLYLLPPCPF